MKAYFTLLLAIPALLLLASCGQSESSDNGNNSSETVSENINTSSDTVSSDQDTEVDTFCEFSTEKELRDYLISTRDTQDPRLFENGELILYSFDNIPQGFEVSRASNNGGFLTCIYEKDNSHISFIWGYGTEGDEYLKVYSQQSGVVPLPDHEGCYYNRSIDDFGTDIFQIYWSKDGHFFQLDIPTALTDISGSGSEKKLNIDLTVSKKTYVE